MSQRPNVLLVTTDHWPAALLGVAGHPVIETPTLDQLARNGVRFTNAYSECPVCIPARRTLMTGTAPRTHGDRTFQPTLPMPPHLPTLAQCFRDAGYQAYAVGKLHVYPQRDRIGFDDVILAEEGRPQFGVIDDYEIFLGEQGYPGQSFGHGMCNNEYLSRPWHLEERLHVTNWATQQMARMIRRRDPTRPGFWYLSYCHPHPPLAPLQAYLDLYRDLAPDRPYVGDWAEEDTDSLPYALQAVRAHWGPFRPEQIDRIRRAFYALCTHIDHQLRVVIGTLREEGILDNTIILFTADHGDMLGNHGLWAKRLFYEYSANIPMILVGPAGDERVGHHRVDERLVGWQDVMPTLLELAGLPVPETVDGLSMVGSQRRQWLYGEFGEGPVATRMVHDGRHKLIYYPTGNHIQLFDLAEDPQECHDVARAAGYASIRAGLIERLMGELYGSDEGWIQGDQLVGEPAQPYRPRPNRGLSGQRGLHWPPPPLELSGQVVGAP
ncbi:sulfatase-like hydrolase/transferase [Litorilinea aerophila]|uniref:Sulfatase-like hydrolase/transferase n=1 Tax=Litorilinea aerophila TaxID=1204385 RepID=A0A540VDQ8_9CHLR|nr:sulfatase-like hydrolase/transferase [Litorilinea aerophila]MCC9077996.1 sulfatase-like hydrolase/transferase [Litorilinea aerophila]GIV76647.1 MAG: arylsulfatase [Litorilinea sp.]